MRPLFWMLLYTHIHFPFPIVVYYNSKVYNSFSATVSNLIMLRASVNLKIVSACSLYSIHSTIYKYIGVLRACGRVRVCKVFYAD